MSRPRLHSYSISILICRSLREVGHEEVSFVAQSRADVASSWALAALEYHPGGRAYRAGVIPRLGDPPTGFGLPYRNSPCTQAAQAGAVHADGALRHRGGQYPCGQAGAWPEREIAAGVYLDAHADRKRVRSGSPDQYCLADPRYGIGWPEPRSQKPVDACAGRA